MGWPKSVLFILISLSILSCEKEEGIVKNSYRLKEVLIKDDGVPFQKMDFFYENENIAEVIYYYKSADSWLPNYKSIFYHEDNYIIHEYYYIKADNFKYKHKNTFKIENNRVIEDTYFVGVKNLWYQNWRWNYTYENNNLTGINSYRYIDGRWIDRGKSTYQYNNFQILEQLSVEFVEGMNIVMDRDSFIWEDNRIVQFIDYNNSEGKLRLNSKSNYSYDDEGNVFQIDLFARRGGEWRPYRTTYYGYDEENNLISQKTSWGSEIHFIYENGHGNFSSFYYMPEEIIFNKPMFKSAGNSEILEEKTYGPNFIFKLLFINGM